MKTNKIITVCSIILCINLSVAQETKRFTSFEKKTMEGVKVGIMKDGIEIVSAIYDKISPESDGKFLVIKDQRVGYVDTTGKELIKPKYYDGINFFDGRAFVFDGKKWGMIDSKSLLKGQMIYDDILGLTEGIGRVVINNKIGYINSAGVQIIPCKYDEGFDCYAGLILVRSKYFDVYGDTKIKGQVVTVGSTEKVFVVYDEKGSIVYKGQKSEDAKFTPNGNVVVTKTFNSPGNFSPPSYSKVISKEGIVIVPYESHYRLTVEDYWIKIDLYPSYTGVGIMSFDGKVILKPNFKSIDEYEKYKDENYYAKVSFKDNSYFYVDIEGKCAEFVDVKCPE